jgi:hypothetical protein
MVECNPYALNTSCVYKYIMVQCAILTEVIMNHHHHAPASMTSLIVCLAIIMLMVSLALSAAHRLTAQIQTGPTTNSAAITHDCANLGSQINANESDAQLEAQATQDQSCANQAETAAAH